MSSRRFSLFALALLGICAPFLCHGTKIKPITAACKLGRFGTARGEIKFVQLKENGPIIITGTISNVAPGKHGWHVHEFGIDSAAEDPCGSAGGHFNPEGMTHGAPTAAVRHVGDLGNFRANSLGFAIVNVQDNLITLIGSNEETVLGRTLVIHADEDDLGLVGDAGSLATGNAGARVGCCVIKKV